MSSDLIQQLLVRITGDTTGLKSAAASANSEIDSIGAAGGGASIEEDAAGATVGLTGMSGAAKTAEKDVGAADKELAAGAKDAEKLGKAAGGGISGILGMATSMTGLPGPVMLVGVAVGATALILDKAAETSDAVKQQVDQLTVAMKDHGESYSDLEPKIEAAIKANEAYGYNADDTREMITKLTEAGLTYGQAQSAMGPIMDLARAKNMSLSDATETYTKAMMGSAKGLKDLGIILPSVNSAAADVSKATTNLTKAQNDLTTANGKVTTATNKVTESQEALTIEEDKLKGKHTLTAAEALALQKAHDAVTTADANLSAAHAGVTTATNNVATAEAALTLAQQGGVDKGARLALINTQLTKAVGDQRGTATEMQVAQAKLNDAWEKFAVKVGPPAQALFADLITVVGSLADDASTLIDYLSGVYGWLEKVGIINDVTTAFKAWVSIEQTGLGAIQSLIKLLGQLFDELGKVGKAIENSPIGALGGMTKGALGAIGGALGSIGLAEGGIATTPTLAMIGEGGEPEAVVPQHLWPALGKGGGGGTVNLTINNPVPEPASRSAFHAGLLLTALGYVP